MAFLVCPAYKVLRGPDGDGIFRECDCEGRAKDYIVAFNARRCHKGRSCAHTPVYRVKGSAEGNLCGVAHFVR